MSILSTYLNWRKQNQIKWLNKEKFPFMKVMLYVFIGYVCIGFPITWLFNKCVGWPNDWTMIFNVVFMSPLFAFLLKYEWNKRKKKMQDQSS